MDFFHYEIEQWLSHIQSHCIFCHMDYLWTSIPYSVSFSSWHSSLLSKAPGTVGSVPAHDPLPSSQQESYDICYQTEMHIVVIHLQILRLLTHLKVASFSCLYFLIFLKGCLPLHVWYFTVLQSRVVALVVTESSLVEVDSDQGKKKLRMSTTSEIFCQFTE